MSRKEYALVKWLAGKEKGTYTPGVPLEWIRNFDKHKYLAEKPNTPYVVQWKSGRKPKGGWRYYDITVATISDSIATLERTMHVMDAAKSPRVVTDQKDENETSPAKPEQSRIRKESSSSSDNENYPKRMRKLSYEEESDDDKEKTKNVDNKNSKKKINDEPFTDLSNVDIIDKSLSNNESLKNVVMENNRMLKELLKRTERLTQSSNNTRMGETKKEKNKKPLVEKKELGWVGSGAFVTETQWHSAIARNGPNLMGVSLLLSVFTMEELLSSNLTGGQSKIKKPNGTEPEKRNALDENKLKGIELAVEERYPDTYNRSSLRIAISNKLARMRNSAGSSKMDQESTSKDDSDES